MNLNRRIQEFKNDFFKEFKKKYPNGSFTFNSVEVKSIKERSNKDIDVTIGIIMGKNYKKDKDDEDKDKNKDKDKEYLYAKTYTIHNYERGLDSAIRIEDTSSRRYKDENGYLHIRDNVIAKAGVFPYRKCEVRSEFEDDDEIVYVCREFEDLERNKDLFANKPVVLTHMWVGKNEDDGTNLVSGVIGNEIRAEFPYLRGDIIIYDHDLIEKIESGEIIELSPGYECDIIQQEDSYEGEPYSFKQLLKNVNHLAVVERGRSGPDLKILDSKPKNIIGETIMMKILDFLFGKKHKIEDALKDSDLLRIEDSETRSNPSLEKYYSPSRNAILKVTDGKMEIEDEDEDEKTQDSDEKIEDEDEEKKTQDSDEKIEDEDIEDEDVEDEDENEDEESQKMKDSAIVKGLVNSEIKRIERRYQKLNDAYQEVKSVIGNDFNTSNMRVSDIYSHGYQCLTGKKLADGMDAKTAFMIAKGSIQTESKKTFDSELNSNASRVNDLLSIIK